jgi:hypothetical protein
MRQFKWIGWNLQKIDAHVIDDVRNFLFGPPGSGGLDLISLNIQRSRDHGLPAYNALRADLGLPRKDRFLTDGLLADNVTPNGITSDPLIASALEGLYGTADNVDLFPGGLAEDPLADSLLGELLTTLWVDQFTRLRDGDRFYYERPGSLTSEELALVKGTTFADILLRNTSITDLQENVFIVPEPATIALVTLAGTMLIGMTTKRRASRRDAEMRRRT